LLTNWEILCIIGCCKLSKPAVLGGRNKASAACRAAFNIRRSKIGSAAV